MKQVQVQTRNKMNLFTAKSLTSIGAMAALACVLMFIKFPIAYIGFLELELSDVPAMLCALTYGPMAGVFVELVKNLIHVMATNTATVGEIANFTISSSYVLGVSLVYKYAKSNKKQLYGYITGTVCLIVSGVLINYFVTLPMYVQLYFGGNEGALYGMASAMVPAIQDMKTLLLLGFIPFNLVKGMVVSIVTYYVWKVFHRFMLESVER